ncbi:hypothetical protein ABEB36_010211 [Hypothenemus hampei]|uniref:Uncharacterized protein n=1 Tax=Hypothenemus hampei TaxID=57062 RepID=A0ABD1EN04_HYPHA
MCPCLEDHRLCSPEIETNNDNNIHLSLTPLSHRSSASSISEENQQEIEENLDDYGLDDIDLVPILRNYVPLEYNIRELLVKVSNSERLETITQLKLRIIATDLVLQQLGMFLPALREFILDGSIISSLRDLGNGLKNLKILKINRCQLACIDGVLGFESLEELYVSDNIIRDLSPCAFFPNLKILDVRNNCLEHLATLKFLSFCPLLKVLSIDGNEIIKNISEHRKIVNVMIPHLEILDGEPLDKDSTFNIREVDDILKAYDKNDRSDNLTRVFNIPRLSSLIKTSPRTENVTEFTVRFPPKVYGHSDKSGKAI